MSVLGIDIGTRFIKIIKLVSTHPPEVYDIHVVETPYTVVEDKEQIDREKLSDILLEKIGNSIKESEIVTCVSSSVVKNIYLSFPQMPANELDEVVPREARVRMVPSPPEDSVFEYLILSKKEQLKLFIAATRKKNIEELLALYFKIKIPSIITFSSFAFIKLLSVVNIDISDVAFIDIGASNTIISFFKDNALQIFSTLHPFCSSMISLLNNNFGLNKAEAEKYLLNVGLPDKIVNSEGSVSEEKSSETTTDDKDEVSKKVDPVRLATLIQPRLKTFISEVKRTILYYRERFGGGDITNIFLTGGGAAIKNIDKLISQNTYWKVKQLNPFENIKLDRVADKVEKFPPSIFATALGLALQNKAETINFLPKEYRKRELPRFVKHINNFLILALSLSLFFFSFWFLRLQRSESAARYLYTQREAVLSKLNQYKEEAKKINARKKKLSDMIFTINKIIKSEPDWEGVFKEITILIPPEAILTNLSIKKTSLNGGIPAYGQKSSTPNPKNSKKGMSSPWMIEISGYVIADYQTSWKILRKMESDFERSFNFNDIRITGPKLEKISVNVRTNEEKIELTKKKKRDFKINARIKLF